MSSLNLVKKKQEIIKEEESYTSSSIENLFSKNSNSESQEDDIEFDIEDLESLQKAQLDNNLLQNYFLQQYENNDFLKKNFLEKHSKLYGYFLIPTD